MFYSYRGEFDHELPLLSFAERYIVFQALRNVSYHSIARII